MVPLIPGPPAVPFALADTALPAGGTRILLAATGFGFAIPPVEKERPTLDPEATGGTLAALAAEIVGNPGPVVMERPTAPGGGGTKVGAVFAGSS